MNKSDYQYLRFAIEAAIHDALAESHVSVADITNNVMRLFLHSIAQSQVRAQRVKREFVTFRRNPELIPPSWALRKPGIDSRLPTL